MNHVFIWPIQIVAKPVATTDWEATDPDLIYFVVIQAAKMVPRVPRVLRWTIAVVVGSIVWLLARNNRRNVVSNVAQVLALPDRPSMRDRIRMQLIARHIFCCCIQNYLDLLALPAFTIEDVFARTDVTGVEHVLEAISGGRGVILFSAHLGPFEVMPFAMLRMFSQFGCEMVVPVEKVSDARMLNLMVGLRQQSGASFVPLDGVAAIVAMVEALQRNQFVLIVADRAIAGRSAEVDFFAAKTKLPRGPVDLAVRTGAPLVGAFAWRGPNGKLFCEFTRLTFALPEDQRDSSEILHAKMVRELEARIAQHLCEWVVFQPVWANRRYAP